MDEQTKVAAKRPRIGGRQKGTPNKLTRSVRDAIARAADELGGPDRLVEWAKEDPKNEHAFWVQVYPKLLPLQLTGEEGGPIKHIFAWAESNAS